MENNAHGRDALSQERLRVSKRFLRGLMPMLGLGVGMASVHAAFAQTVPVSTTQNSDQGLTEIVVTATRTEELASRVPISVTVFSQDAIDQRGIRSFDDLAQLVPGVSFGKTGFGEQTAISIRGISSLVGPATTGMYIDDVPVQVRNVGFSSSNLYPAVFDLERVEILRGPQGTLFGAGAEGGAVRFITPQINFSGDSPSYMRSEVANTQSGDLSYEFGAAKGGVLINDELAFRASAYYRQDGGWINREPYPAQAGPDEGQSNSNWSDVVVVHTELGWKPTDRLTVVASIFAQEFHQNDSSNFWVSTPNGPLSNPRNLDYINGNGEPETSDDNFVLPSLTVKYALDSAELTSTTSYLTRYQPGDYDYRTFMNATFGGGANPLPVFATPGYFDHGFLWNRQNNWTQEIRLQSTDKSSRLQWLGGVFVQSAAQSSAEILDTPFFDVTTGVPNASVVFFGAPLVDGKYVYIDHNSTLDKQYAAFGDVTYNIIGGLKVEAGVRVARSEVDITDVRAAPGDGFGSNSGTEKSTPVTPKVSITEQIDDGNMLYVSAAKGYRSGGANRPLPVNPQCTANLQSIGYSAAPATYGPDNVWSYELGSKNSFLDNHLKLASSVFYIQWNNIINDVTLPNCGLDFISNLGKATSKGFDTEIDVQPFRSLLITAAVGYVDARYDKTVEAAGATSPIVREGWTLAGAPWTLSTGIKYQFSGPVGVPSYVRADYWYQTKNNGLTATSDPTSAQYNPTYLIDPAQQNLNLRLGWQIDSWDLSAFVNNATDRHYDLEVNNQALGGQIIQATSVRPRTYGITLSGRF